MRLIQEAWASKGVCLGCLIIRGPLGILQRGDLWLWPWENWTRKRYDIVLQTVSLPTIIQNKWLRVSFPSYLCPKVYKPHQVIRRSYYTSNIVYGEQRGKKKNPLSSHTKQEFLTWGLWTSKGSMSSQDPWTWMIKNINIFIYLLSKCIISLQL